MTKIERLKRDVYFLNAAKAGHSAAAATSNPYLASSPASMAWSLGRWLATVEHLEPDAVRPGVGYTIWSNGNLYDMTDEAAPRAIRRQVVEAGSLFA